LSFKGLWEVFTGPGKFFDRLKDDPRILVPWIAMILMGVLYSFFLRDIMAQTQIEAARAQGREIPDAAIGFVKISVMVGMPVMMVIGPLIVAAITLFFTNVIFSLRTKFSHLLSVVLYAGIINLVGLLLTVPLVLQKGSMDVSFSPAVLVADQGIQSFAYQALAQFNVFNIWQIVVAGIGFRYICRTTSNKGYTIAVLSYGIIILVSIGMAALGQAFN